MCKKNDYGGEECYPNVCVKFKLLMIQDLKDDNITKYIEKISKAVWCYLLFLTTSIKQWLDLELDTKL